MSQLLCRRFLLENARTPTAFLLCRTAIRTGDRKAVPASAQFMDWDRVSIGFTNIGGASINQLTPGVNHPGVGIYLNLPVEIVRAAALKILRPFANLPKLSFCEGRNKTQLEGGPRPRPGESVAAICKSCKTVAFPAARGSAESKKGASSKPRAAGAANRSR